jgi:DNA mismatch endonuclease, patch repair protein
MAIAISTSQGWDKRCGHLPNTRRSFWRAKLSTTVKRDREITRTLCAAGLTVLRVWEHELRVDTEQVLARLTSLLTGIEDTSP